MDIFAVYEDPRAFANGVSSENSLNLFEKVAKIQNEFAIKTYSIIEEIWKQVFSIFVTKKQRGAMIFSRKGE